MNDSVLILAGNSSTQDLMASIRSFKASGARNIMMLDSAKYGFQPVMDPSVRLFHSEDALMEAVSPMDGFVFVARRFVAPKDFANVVFGGNRSPGTAYGLSGFRVVSPPSDGKRMATVRQWSRGPNSPRYLMNDSGDEPVDFFTDLGLLVHSSAFRSVCARGVMGTLGDPARASAAFIRAGMPMVCMETGWGRPVRLSTRNIGMRTVSETEMILFNRRRGQGGETPGIGVAPEGTKTEQPRDATGLPILSVVFQTHNRTATACFCLDTMCRNLRYAGQIHYCVCDDRSDDGHVDALVGVLRRNGVSNFSLHYTDGSRWGLGASMNNGLKWSFKFTDVVLTAEDDFMLAKELDITPYVKECLKPDVAMVKMASVTVSYNPLFDCGHPGFKQCGSNKSRPHSQWYTFNNLVALRHRRVFDEIGMYPENCHPAAMEVGMLDKFNRAYDAGFSGRMRILWPTRLRTDTYETEWFVHIGRSTVGHRDTPSVRKFSHLADPELDRKTRERAAEEARRTFLIVIPCYNSAKLLERCLASVSRQSLRDDAIVAVVDDDSSGENARIELDACSRCKAVLMPLHENRCAGGARNLAMDKLAGRAEYVMFVDSDDEFVGDSAMARVRRAIDDGGKPDVVCLGYVGSDGKTRPATAKSAFDRMAVAPWTRCTKASLAPRFAENVRMCNDTLQYIRTIDSANTVVSVPDAIVRYNSDNPESCWHSSSAKRSRKAMEGMFSTVMDLLFGEFSRPHAKSEARLSARFIMKNLAGAISEVLNGK